MRAAAPDAAKIAAKAIRTGGAYQRPRRHSPTREAGCAHACREWRLRLRLAGGTVASLRGRILRDGCAVTAERARPPEQNEGPGKKEKAGRRESPGLSTINRPSTR